MTTISNYGVFTVNGNIISDIDIQLRLIDLNYATFVSTDYYTVGTSITIEYPASGLVSTTPVFTGKVTQCRKLARTDDGKTRYAIECVEPAIELQSKYVTLSSDLKYTGLYINNVRKSKTLGQYVGYILQYLPEWGDSSDYQYKNKSIVSGGASTDAIPSMGFSTSTAWSALQRLVVSIFNYGLWFEYPSGTKKIRYGEYNKDVPAGSYPTPINITLHESSINSNIDGVVVYADSDEITPQSYGSVGPTSDVVAYRYTQCQSADELKWVAKRLYEERSVPNIRYEIEFPVGFYNIREGDRIHIFDDSVGLSYNTDGYGVKDVRIMYNKTVVGIGASKLTIFDILNDRLSLIDGGILLIDTKSIDTNWVNVVNSDDNNIDTWGGMSAEDLVIEGETFMGNFVLTPYFGAAGIENSGYFRVYSAIGHSTADFTVSASNPLYMTGYDPTTFTGPFMPYMFPWSWRWVDIEVRYIYDENVSASAELEVECVWGTIATIPEWIPPAPPTVTSRAMVVEADGVVIPSSSTRSQLHHKWFVNSCDQIPHSYPIITVTPTGDIDDILIHDALLLTTVYYESDEYPPITDTFSQGEIQMKIGHYDSGNNWVDDMDWLTIYKRLGSTDGERDAMAATYENKEYDMADYLNYTSFDIGRYLILYRCRADAPDAEHTGHGAVRMIGKYDAFNEKTRVIP